MARASADVVATTSLVEGLMKTLRSFNISAYRKWMTPSLKGTLRGEGLTEYLGIQQAAGAECRAKTCHIWQEAGQDISSAEA